MEYTGGEHVALRGGEHLLAGRTRQQIQFPIKGEDLVEIAMRRIAGGRLGAEETGPPQRVGALAHARGFIEAFHRRQTFAQLKSTIGDRLQHGSLELALVGDIDESNAIALVAKTLGALPAREPQDRPYTDNRDRSFTAQRGVHTLYHTGAANQALVDFDWPTRDNKDFVEDRKLEMLQRVVDIELTDNLREELGQTYSPQVEAEQSRYYPGWGTFEIEASVDTSQVDATRKAMIETIAKLRAAPVDDDVLLRARQPLLEAYDNALKTNEGWMNLVERAQSKPERIDRFLKGKEIVQGLTAADVQAMAQRYLDPDQRLEIDVLPKKAAQGGAK